MNEKLFSALLNQAHIFVCPRPHMGNPDPSKSIPLLTPLQTPPNRKLFDVSQATLLLNLESFKCLPPFLKKNLHAADLKEVFSVSILMFLRVFICGEADRSGRGRCCSSCWICCCCCWGIWGDCFQISHEHSKRVHPEKTFPQNGCIPDDPPITESKRKP